MKLRLETEGREDLPEIPSGGAEFVAFMSFAHMRGFGAQHPYIALADRLHDAHGVSMGPLTTFYESEIEDSEDAEKLEMAWQSATPLLAAVEAMAAALAADPLCLALAARAEAAGLACQALALLPPLRAARDEGARVRLSYSL